MDDELQEIHQPVRLRLLATLVRQHDLGFVALRDGLGLSDGNMASHMKRLIDREWVAARHALVGDHFEVRYRVTKEGIRAFHRYLAWLRDFLGQQDL